MIGLAGFAGLWALSRRIEDARAGQVSVLEGTARFAGDGAGLTCDEAGTLHVPGQPPMAATRRYLWRETGGGIAVLFADGRAFHRFDPAGGAPGDTHHCRPDTYVVTYDFTRWPRWRARWRVTGPGKDYVMVSCYAPFAGAETEKLGLEGKEWPIR